MLNHQLVWLYPLVKFRLGAATVKAMTDCLEPLRLTATARCTTREDISANTAIQGNAFMVCSL